MFSLPNPTSGSPPVCTNWLILSGTWMSISSVVIEVFHLKHNTNSVGFVFWGKLVSPWSSRAIHLIVVELFQSETPQRVTLLAWLKTQLQITAAEYRWQHKGWAVVAVRRVVNPTVGVNGVEISEFVSHLLLLHTTHFPPSILLKKSKCYYICSQKLFYQLTNVQWDGWQLFHTDLLKHRAACVLFRRLGTSLIQRTVQ